MKDLIINVLRDKNILIAGFGREGKSTFNFIQKNLPSTKVSVADKNENAVNDINPQLIHQFFSGPDYLSHIRDFDLVIKTPGISLKDINVHGVNITSQTDIFLQAFHSQTVGITGTKGKSTTSSLIYHILITSQRDALLAGNIGIPIFDIIDDIKPSTTVVMELSAHQLQFIHQAPHTGLLLNVFEEHLDHFGTFQNYQNAKLNILRKMNVDDNAFIHSDLLPLTSEFRCTSVAFDKSATPFISGDYPLQGSHNVLNMKAASLACLSLGLTPDEINNGLHSFKPLEHRLENLGSFNGISFFNDSISTIPQATIAALSTLKHVDFLILGGFDRGIDYQPLATFLNENPVKHIFLTGKAGESIDLQLKKVDYQGMRYHFDELKEVFSSLRQLHQGQEICLLSPAAASYDRYKNFEERGKLFKSLAQQFAQ